MMNRREILRTGAGVMASAAIADEWIRQMLRLMVRHQPLAWFGEAGPIRRSVEPFLKQRMTDGNVWCRLEWLASINDNASRARAIQAMAASGKAYLAKGAGWASDVLGQLLRFPAAGGVVHREGDDPDPSRLDPFQQLHTRVP